MDVSKVACHHLRLSPLGDVVSGLVSWSVGMLHPNVTLTNGGEPGSIPDTRRNRNSGDVARERGMLSRDVEV